MNFSPGVTFFGAVMVLMMRAPTFMFLILLSFDWMAKGTNDDLKVLLFGITINVKICPGDYSSADLGLKDCIER